MKPPFTVAVVGKKRWPRFFVRDGQGRYWTGDGWSDEPAHGLLFHIEKEAQEEATAMQNYAGKPRRFTTTAEITVEVDETHSLEVVREYLSLHIVGLLGCALDHVCEGADVDLRMNWEELREIDE